VEGGATANPQIIIISPKVPPKSLPKDGINMKAVFWLGIMVLMQTSRPHFKQSKISLLIPHIYILDCLVIFWGIFGYIWG